MPHTRWSRASLRIPEAAPLQAQLATEPGSAKNLVAVVNTIGQITKARDDQVAAVENATLKYARTVGGAEQLTKQFHLLMHTVLSLALYGSNEEAVWAMDPNTFFALLLDRSATTCIEDGKLALWVEALDAVD